MYEKSGCIALKRIIFALQMRTSKILVTNEDYLSYRHCEKAFSADEAIFMARTNVRVK